MNYLLIGQIPGLAVVAVWPAAGLALTVLGDFAPDVVRSIFHELRPWYLPAVVGEYLAEAMRTGPDGWSIFGLVVHVVAWFMYKDSGGDDDRWKRRRQRLAESVQVVDGRLAVVAGES